MKSNTNKASDPLLNHPALKDERRARAQSEMEAPHRRRSFIVQIAMFFVVLVLWQFPIINPIKLLVVLFHEMSHAVAAYATGGVVFGLAIDPGGAGVTLGMHGSELTIVAAGYVGSLLIGVALYYLSAVWEPWEVWLVLTLMCCASLFVGWLNDFTAVFGYGTLAAMMCGLALSERAKKFLLRLVATTCCLYAVIDVVGDVVRNRAEGFMVRGQLIGSDVGQLARLSSLPEGLIASAWVIIGVISAVYLIDWAASKDAATAVKRSLFRRRQKEKADFEYKIYDPSDPNSINEFVIR